jgi:uncharacterized OB-fold protein
MATDTVPPGTEGFLVPQGDEESVGFWAGTAEGELRVQACGACGKFRFPPRVMCPHCQSTERLWRAVSGQGTIWSFVVAHPPLLPAYAPFAPFPVNTVTLTEDPAPIVIGEPVHVVFSPRLGPDGSTISLPAWVRRADEASTNGPLGLRKVPAYPSFPIHEG